MINPYESVDLNSPNAAGETAVHLIAQSGDKDLLQWLKNQASTGTVELFRLTRTQCNLYHYAPHVTCPEFLKCLFSLTTDPNILFACNSALKTPIALAIECDNALFLEHYLRHYPLSLLLRDVQNRNIFHLIAQNNAVNCYNKLCGLLKVSDIEALQYAKDQQSLTPIETAAQLLNDVHKQLQGYQRSNGAPSLEWQAKLALVKEEVKKTYTPTLSWMNEMKEKELTFVTAFEKQVPLDDQTTSFQDAYRCTINALIEEAIDDRDFVVDQVEDTTSCSI